MISSNQAQLAYTPPSSTSPPGETRRPAFRGEGLTLLGILLLNGLLTIVTFGVYYFWGKAKLRKYLLGSLELEGERFDFHGTGGELFVGWLKVAGVFAGAGGLQALLAMIFGGESIVVIVVTVLFYMGITTLVPFAIVGALRYRLSRTSWRGVRFSFRGDSVDLLRIFLPGVALSVVTLGFYAPVFFNDMYAYLTNHSQYGDRRFRYDGNGQDLFRMYLKGLLFGILTLGVYFFWYQADRVRYLREHTTFGGARLGSTMTGGGLLGLALTNLLLVLFTCGLALPWVLVRTMRFQADNLVLRGPLELASVSPSEDPGSAVGEELADALDVGAGIDL